MNEQYPPLPEAVREVITLHQPTEYTEHVVTGSHYTADQMRAYAAAALAQRDAALLCDFCGCETPDPWHGSTESNRHVHACDACKPKLYARHAEKLAAYELTVAEIERLRVDAARYRWLRKEHEFIDPPICHLCWKKNGIRNSSVWVNTVGLDASIDAAMKETP